MKKNYIVKSMVLALVVLGSFSGFSHPKSQNKHSHDSNAIAFVEIVDRHEIAMSKIAKDKLKNSDAKDFAQLMIADHEKNLNDAREISKKTKIAPHENKKLKDLKANAKKHEKTLAKVSPDMMDKKYIDAMVKGHEDADKQLTKLSDEAKDSTLKKFLKDTLVAVKSHLEKAKKIQQNLAAKAKAAPAMHRP